MARPMPACWAGQMGATCSSAAPPITRRKRRFSCGGAGALKGGEVVGIGDAAAQARQFFANIEAALAEAGASLRDVVSLRCYLVEKSAYEGYAEVKSMLFKDESPASTTVIISALLLSD